MRTRPRYISLMRALVRREEFLVDSGSAEAFPSRLEAMELPEHLKAEVEPLLSLMEPLVVSAIVPEGLCDRFFLGAGFAYPALSQLELAHPFSR